MAPIAASCAEESGASEATGSHAAGNVRDLPLPTIKPLPGVPLVIARDAAGVYAMSTLCTHAQCDMNGTDGRISNAELACSCHGSRFDPNGVPITGPAGRPLPHYAVTISTEGDIVIMAGSAVGANVRVAVP